MDTVLNEKPKGPLKKWSIAGIVAVLAFFVLYVLIEMQSYQYITMMYGMEPSGLDIANDFLSINGLFSAAALIFFIGLFASKKRGFFMPFMLWTMLLTNLYFVMPKLSSLVELFYSLTGMQLMYYLGLILPQIVLSALLVSFILQKGSENKKITQNLALVTMIFGVVYFVFQMIYGARTDERRGCDCKNQHSLGRGRYCGGHMPCGSDPCGL